ncbi:MAG: hypothetical protein KGK01_13385 [Bradyrhizobium sp.]|uniref:hypothetical protein n=1 Tax=Bradyrhizobium sp. TaxID=376 RepID=UPI001C284418|nr:hypothetical protein [Pseudomonadota bacterium]MDE2069357.1 hypothetical protein [Bradyrhizobium sp.]MDE2243382.1 hypothetical protein [Bradyrhizobium sp.]
MAIADRLVGEPALKSYHLLGSVRGDLLHKLGRFKEARMTLEAAANLATNRRERELLRRRRGNRSTVRDFGEGTRSIRLRSRDDWMPVGRDRT